MTESNIIAGEIYHIDNTNFDHDAFRYIMNARKTGTLEIISTLTIKSLIKEEDNNYLYFNDGSYFNRYDKIRLAFPLEKQWLEECIKKGEYIPYSFIHTEQEFEIL